MSVKQSVVRARVSSKHDVVTLHFRSSRAFIEMDELFLKLVSIVSADEESKPLSSNRPTVPGTVA